MVTVVDPGGTPAPVYNRSGVTIQGVSGAGTNFGGATPIVASSGHSIALVSTVTNDEGVILPDTAEIGDVAEVYRVTDTAAVRVYPPAGDTLYGGGASHLLGSQGAIFRKTSATRWHFIGN